MKIEETKMNKHAAPDLLKALKLISELSPKNDYETYRNAVKEIATNAIRLAEGKG